MSSLESSAALPALPGDFVSSDFDALALHMQECERARGRLFSLQGGLERIQSIAAGRIVTVAFFAFVMGLGLVAIA